MSYNLFRRSYVTTRDNRQNDGGMPVGTHEGDAHAFLRRHERDCSGCDLSTRSERYRLARDCMERIADTRNLWCAVQHLVRHGGKAPGPNGQRLHRLVATDQKWVRGELRRLSSEVGTGTYRPGPVRRIDIPKSSGKGTRPIEVANWQDQVVQRAIVQIVQPMIDPLLDELSLGFRPGRDRNEAAANAVHLMQRTDRNVLISADLKVAFTTVPHAPLLERVQALLGNEQLTRLIGRTIKGYDRTRGIPQGGALSPLLLNIHLDSVLDQRWKRRQPGTPLIRYADDVLLLCQSVEEAHLAYESLEELLQPTGMKLKGNCESDITDLRTHQRTEWLGYSLGLEGGETTIRVGSKFGPKLQHHLKEAMAEVDGALVVQGTIKGTIEQLGPCFHEDHQRVFCQIRAIAREQGIGEIPSDDELLRVWQQAHALRDAAQMPTGARHDT